MEVLSLVLIWVGKLVLLPQIEIFPKPFYFVSSEMKRYCFGFLWTILHSGGYYLIERALVITMSQCTIGKQSRVEGDRGVRNSRLPYLELPLPALFHRGSRLCSISIIKCYAMLRNFSQFLPGSRLFGNPASHLPCPSRPPVPLHSRRNMFFKIKLYWKDNRQQDQKWLRFITNRNTDNCNAFKFD